MAKKGPQYMMCNEQQSSCVRPSANPSRGCPDCEYTIQNSIFKKELKAELKLIRRTTRKQNRKWDSERMIKLVNLAAVTSNIAGKKMDKSWTTVLTTLVTIYRNEQARVKAIDNWTVQQQLNSK